MILLKNRQSILQITVLSFFFFCLLLIMGCEKNDLNIHESDDFVKSNYTIYVKASINEDDIYSVSNISDIDVQYVNYNVVVDGEQYGGGVAFRVLNHSTFKQDMVSHISTSIGLSSKKIDLQSDWSTDNPFVEIENLESKVSAFMVTSLNVYATQAGIKSIMNEPYVISIDEVLQSDSEDISDVNLRSSTWKPKWGTVDIGALSSSVRYVSHTMKWQDVSGFNSTSTYEHDFFLNNYSGSMYPGTYLSRDEVPTNMPDVISWSSNLPYDYLDTRFMDSSDEVAYTIGCAKASNIIVNKWYNCSITIDKGDANVDNAKLVAQKGYRSPSGCYTTWCSFANANSTILSAWTIGVPGGLSWQN